MQLVHAGLRVIARAAARLQQKQRVGVERGDVEVVRILAGDPLHRLRVGAILFDALLEVERLDVAHGHRVDERPLLRGRLVTQRQRLARRGVRVR